jgi:hypothetical protein
MKRPESVNNAELGKYSKKAMHIKNISLKDLQGIDPDLPISPRVTQSPSSVIRTNVQPRTQPIAIPADSFTMNYEFPAFQNRGLHRERPHRKEPTQIVLPQQRLPSRREVRSLFRKHTANSPKDQTWNEETPPNQSIFALPIFVI